MLQSIAPKIIGCLTLLGIGFISGRLSAFKQIDSFIFKLFDDERNFIYFGLNPGSEVLLATTISGLMWRPAIGLIMFVVTSLIFIQIYMLIKLMLAKQKIHRRFPDK